MERVRICNCHGSCEQHGPSPQSTTRRGRLGQIRRLLLVIDLLNSHSVNPESISLLHIVPLFSRPVHIVLPPPISSPLQYTYTPTLQLVVLPLPRKTNHGFTPRPHLFRSFHKQTKHIITPQRPICSVLGTPPLSPWPSPHSPSSSFCSSYPSPSPSPPTVAVAAATTMRTPTPPGASSRISDLSR